MKWVSPCENLKLAVGTCAMGREGDRGRVTPKVFQRTGRTIEIIDERADMWQLRRVCSVQAAETYKSIKRRSTAKQDAEYDAGS